jgi:predicted NBD/HSP70 family sugar kinase
MAALKRNSRLILDILAEEAKGLTRTELRHRAGLSRPTVQAIVTELKDEGFIAEAPPEAAIPEDEEPATGRPAERFVLARNAGLVVGIDIGHGHVRAAVADRSGEVLGEVQEDTNILVDEVGTSALTRAAELTADAVASSEEPIEAVRAIGLGIPASIDDQGFVLFADSLPGWGRPVDITKELKRLLTERFPTFALDRNMITVENDANLGALGEGLHGAPRGCRNYLYLKLSTGVGMGMVLDGRLYRGTNGASGEAGHVTVSPMADRLIKSAILRPKEPCLRCSKLDCLENLASSRAIVCQLQATNTEYAANLKIQDVIQRAKRDVSNHQLCLQALVDAGVRIGYTLTDAIRLLAPEQIVLGGLLAEAGEILTTQVDEAIKGSKGLLPVAVSAVPVERIERSEVLGAIALALRTASAVSSTRGKR